MKYVPKGLSRFANMSLLKLNANSPTILVVAGVVGLGATAVLAAKATRNIDPVLDQHKQARAEIGYINKGDRATQKQVVKLYANTGADLARVYAAPLVLGTLSTASILYGHKILHGRHMASLAAYTGLMEQFQAYRSRVAKTLGPDVERGIYEGAHGEWEEDPDHKGEYKLVPKFDPNDEQNEYCRPWFDETNVHWTKDPIANFLFLKGVQEHFNNLLSIRGYVVLNDVLEQLRMPKCDEGMVAGWIYNKDGGKGPLGTSDNYIDFGFMSGIDPMTVAFRNGVERSVRLNFNIDGNIYGLLKSKNSR